MNEQNNERTRITATDIRRTKIRTSRKGITPPPKNLKEIVLICFGAIVFIGLVSFGTGGFFTGWIAGCWINVAIQRCIEYTLCIENPDPDSFDDDDDDDDDD